MTLAVILLDTAVRDMRRILGKDPAAFARARRAIAALAADPHPDGAVPWGGTGLLRLHAGSIRVLYEVDEDAVYVVNVGVVS